MRSMNLLYVWRTGAENLLQLTSVGGACHWRLYATSTMNIFDRKCKRMQRNRTAALPDCETYDYIKEEVGYWVADRISDVKRQFPVALDLGCGRGHISKHVYQEMVGTLYQSDMAEHVLAQAAVSPEVPTHKIHCDEEFLPFPHNSLDLVVTSLSLHWVNDLPGCFRQVQQCLRPDGCFIGAVFGGDTLFEMRVALQLAEQERDGGLSPRVSPFTSVRDLGGLLNAAGFNMITLDTDEMTIRYPSLYELMTDLQGMGENNCQWSRKGRLNPDTTAAAAAIYKEMYSGGEEGVPATFNIVSFIGWKPDKSQAAPAKRGSANVSLKDLDRIDKIASDLDKLKDKSKGDTRYDKTFLELNESIEKLRRKTLEDTTDDQSDKT